MLNYVVVALIVVTVLFFISEIVFIIGFLKMRNRIDELNAHYDYFKRLVEINDASMQKMDDYVTRTLEREDLIVKIANNIEDQYDNVKETYDTLTKAYEIISSQYRTMAEMHSKILEAWSQVEERYSDCYEQLKLEKDSIKELKQMVYHQKDYIEDEFLKINDLIYDFMKPWEVEGLYPSEDDEENPFIEKQNTKCEVCAFSVKDENGNNTICGLNEPICK